MAKMLSNYLGLVRFSHTIFALPFALLSALLAWQAVPVRWLDAAGILFCMVFARNFAMAVNRLADRHIDGRNPRTAGRHLPAGLLSARAVALFTLANALLFIASTFLFANPWPSYLALPVLGFLAAYSWTKRFTALAHFWLGTALALAPLAAWIALRGPVSLETPLFLSASVLFWVAGFDILYACQDAEFDRREGLHSVPARLGVQRSLHVAALCHAIMLALLLGLAVVSPHLGPIFLSGLGVIALLLIYEHWLVRPDDLSQVNRAFFQVNGIISIGLLLLVVADLLMK